MAGDDKLRCAVVYRLEAPGPTAIILAKYDYAAETSSSVGDDFSGGSGGCGVGNKKADFAKAVARVISNDPPTGVDARSKCGGFKVVQADVHQVVYGADANNICKQKACTKATAFRMTVYYMLELSCNLHLA